MVSERKKEERLLRKQRIINAALSVFNKLGIEKTTMEEIANTIGGEVKFIPRRNFEVEAHQADMSNCYKLLDWRPKVKVLEWLSDFVKKI